jgi:hypothetical protein
MRWFLAFLFATSLVLTACQVAFDGEAIVGNWLEAASGGAEDRGWSLLDSSSQGRYDGDRSTYIDDASAVDWDSFGYEIAGSFEDDGIWTVLVRVDGGWEAVPAFIREHQLVGIHCEDDQPVGFAAIVSQPAFAGPQLGAGADPSDIACD